MQVTQVVVDDDRVGVVGGISEKIVDLLTPQVDLYMAVLTPALSIPVIL